MAIDHGTRRIGIAFCDPDELLAIAYAVWPNQKDTTVQRLSQLAREEGVQGIVIGLPRHLDGTESATAPSVREFAAAVEAALDPPLPVCFWGEQLTSVEAEKLVTQAGRGRDRKKLDAIAAALMLEDLLSSRRNRGIPPGSAEV